MEYISFGNFRSYLKAKWSEDEAKDITRQLLEGLVIIHQEGFAHRDLKPEVRPPGYLGANAHLTKGIEHLCGL